MKQNKLHALVGALLLSGVGGAWAQSAPTEAMLSAQDEVSSTALCLVGVSNPMGGLSACFCLMNGGPEETCNSVSTYFPFPATFGAALGQATDYLSTIIEDGPEEARLPLYPEGQGVVLMDARASCNLSQNTLEIAVADESEKKGLKGILGAKALYTAVYAFPVMRADSQASWIAATDRDGADLSPVRMCALGQASVMKAGTLRIRRGGRDDHRDDDHGRYNWSANYAGLNLGVAGAAQWAALNSPQNEGDREFGIKYVVVAGVADALMVVGKKRFDAIALLANSTISDRSLHLKRFPVLDGQQDILVQDQDVSEK